MTNQEEITGSRWMPQGMSVQGVDDYVQVPSKQEEIREGIAEIVESVTGCSGWKAREVAVKVTEKQDSQGVVIKIEDWLPIRSGMTCTVDSLIEEGR